MARFIYAVSAERQSIVTVTFGGRAVIRNVSHHAVMTLWDRMHGLMQRKARGSDGWMVVACSSVKGTKGTRGGFCVASLSANRRLLVGGWWQVHPARKGATK